MAYLGAKNKTEEEIANVMRFELNQTNFHPLFNIVQKRLNTIQNRGEVKLSITNSLWGQQGYSFLNSFLNGINEYYSADLQMLDFRNHADESRYIINKWVEAKTNEKIKDLLLPGTIVPSTNLVLCNAIYFKGKWKNQFIPQHSREQAFYSNGRNKQVKMMIHTKSYKTVSFSDMDMIELPYNGSELSMIIILPKQNDGLKLVESKMNFNYLNNAITELEKTEPNQVDLFLPKFKISSSFELSDILAGMGMYSAFNNADFSGFTGKKDFSISNIVHKTYIDVDEAGTEAAAATAVVFRQTAVQTTSYFKVDHPFIYLIRDNIHGSLLFMGRLVDPLYE
jgi:serpin B